MSGSSIGKIFKLTTFGESHGIALGGVIEGLPAGIEIDLEKIQAELARRKPGQSAIVTQRKEDDEVEILSGLFENKTLGTPLGFIIRNQDQKSKDYSEIKDAYRPSHADFTYDKKYGIRDYRGGGRSSARETVCRVVAGAFAAQILESKGIQTFSFVQSIGLINEYFSPSLSLNQQEIVDIKSKIDSNIIRAVTQHTADEMENLIREVRKKGDTIGGIIQTYVYGVPAGLGEPVFDKLHADLGKAILSINAVKGFEIGSGFSSIAMLGSDHNDQFNQDGSTKTNHSGGVQGGISNGMPINFKTAFKPVATLMQDVETINSKGEDVVMKGKGRHDACVLPRAVPIVDAMTNIVLLDFLLRNQASRLL